MNSNGYLAVEYPLNKTFYSAYRSDNATYFSNRYLNPLYGYHYEIELQNTTVKYYRTVWTNGVDKTYPAPNATLKFYKDRSYVVTDSSGKTFYFISYWENLDPNRRDYYYNASDHSLTWINTFKPSNLAQTTTSDASCTYHRTTYTDYSAAPYSAHDCKNGSFMFFPSQWTNFSSNYMTQRWGILYIHYYANCSYRTYYTHTYNQGRDSILFERDWGYNCSSYSLPYS